MEFICKVPLLSEIHLPKSWTKITDMMILFWYTSLRKIIQALKCYNIKWVFLVNVAICRSITINALLWGENSYYLISSQRTDREWNIAVQNSNWYQYWFSILVRIKSIFHWFWIKRYFSLKCRKIIYWLFEV